MIGKWLRRLGEAITDKVLDKALWRSKRCRDVRHDNAGAFRLIVRRLAVELESRMETLVVREVEQSTLRRQTQVDFR